MVQFKAQGQAGIGGGIKLPPLGHFAPGTPGFYGLIIFAAAVIVLMAVAHTML